MSDTLVVDIAGFRAALQIADQAMAAKTRTSYLEFLVADGKPLITIQVSVTPGASFIPQLPGPWIIETTLSGDHLTYRSYAESGWVDFKRGTGELELAPEAYVENFLRVLYAHLCTRAGALLLHAAGVIRAGQGYVFFGPSGSGKSTTSRLSHDSGCTVLSDDLVIIRAVGGAYRVFGVPFRGTATELPRTRADAPLAGIYELVKGQQHSVTRLSRPRAVAALSRSVPFVMESPLSCGAVIAFCAELAQFLPPAQLHFRKDDGFWKVIDESRETVSSAP